MDLKESDILKDNIFQHWYYRLKSEVLLRTIGNELFPVVTDIGAGSGYFSKRILAENKASSALCVDIGYESDSQELWNNKKIEYVKSSSSFPDGLVLLMDVLEHVDDDLDFLKEYANKAKKGSKFFITVPAFQFMFSSHDIFLEHHRRYTISSLSKVVQSAGLNILSSNYFYGTLFPLVAIVRILKKLFSLFSTEYKPMSELKLHGNFINNFYYYIHQPELLVFKFNKLYGLSIVLYAEKK